MTQYYICNFKVNTFVDLKQVLGFNLQNDIIKSGDVNRTIYAKGLLIIDDNSINGYDKEHLEFIRINPDTIHLKNEPTLSGTFVDTDNLDYNDLDWEEVNRIRPATKADLIFAGLEI